MGVARQFLVVVAHDRKIGGHAQALFLRRFHDTDRHKIVAAEDGGRRIWHGEQFQPGLVTAQSQPVAIPHKPLVEGDIGGGERLIGQDDFLGFPIPAWIALAAYVIGWLVLEKLPIGRHILAIGDGEATAGLMGLKVERALTGVYLASGTLAGLAGVILASQFGAGQPTEGVGWELFAIASVVVGGTLLSGGSGSIGATLAGALLLAMVFNILNFENGLGWISLSAYWQSVIRGAFLLVVVVLQAKLMARHRST